MTETGPLQRTPPTAPQQGTPYRRLGFHTGDSFTGHPVGDPYWRPLQEVSYRGAPHGTPYRGPLYGTP